MPEDKIKNIIIICGRISSGKSTFANHISETFNIPIASFGAYLKHYCQEAKLPIDRATLQNVGTVLIKEATTKFLRNVIRFSQNDSDTVILDGVRHRIIIKRLRRVCDRHLILFTNPPQADVLSWYNDRKKDIDFDAKPFEHRKIENHPVEFEVEQLKLFADLIVNPNSEGYTKVDSLVKDFLSQ